MLGKILLPGIILENTSNNVFTHYIQVYMQSCQEEGIPQFEIDYKIEQDAIKIRAVRH